MDISQIEVLIIDPKKDQKLAVETFSKFKEIWSETYKELEHDSPVTSDPILYSSNILVIKIKGEVAAFSIFNKFQLDNPIQYERSWFKEWTQVDLAKAFKIKSKGVAAFNSFFSVTKEYRKYEIEGVRLSQLLAYFSTLTQLELGIDMMFGQMHNKRSVSKYTSHIGSTLIRKNAKMFNTVSDLMVFTKENIQNAQSDYPEIAKKIFFQTRKQKSVA